VLVQTTALRDGTFRAAHLRVLSHERRAIVRGVVMRRLARSTLVATGHSIVRIRSGATRTTASARDHGDLRIGEIGEFRIRFDDDDLVAEHVQAVGQAGNVRIEGAVVSVSPFVVSLEGLPITITGSGWIYASGGARRRRPHRAHRAGGSGECLHPRLDR